MPYKRQLQITAENRKPYARSALGSLLACKVRNITRDHRVSLLLGSGMTMQDIKGIMIQGRARVYSAPEMVLQLGQEGTRQRGVPENALPHAPHPRFTYIEVELQRIISWDDSRDSDPT